MMNVELLDFGGILIIEDILHEANLFYPLLSAFHGFMELLAGLKLYVIYVLRLEEFHHFTHWDDIIFVQVANYAAIFILKIF